VSYGNWGRLNEYRTNEKTRGDDGDHVCCCCAWGDMNHLLYRNLSKEASVKVNIINIERFHYAVV
jgi:hypothetical protein